MRLLLYGFHWFLRNDLCFVGWRLATVRNFLVLFQSCLVIFIHRRMLSSYSVPFRIGTQSNRSAHQPVNGFWGISAIALAGCLRRFSACIIFVIDTLSPIRYVSAASAVELLRNAIVASWADTRISLLGFEFRVRNRAHIVSLNYGWNVSVGSSK